MQQPTALVKILAPINRSSDLFVYYFLFSFGLHVRISLCLFIARRSIFEIVYYERYYERFMYTYIKGSGMRRQTDTKYQLLKYIKFPQPFFGEIPPPCMGRRCIETLRPFASAYKCMTNDKRVKPQNLKSKAHSNEEAFCWKNTIKKREENTLIIKKKLLTTIGSARCSGKTSKKEELSRN